MECCILYRHISSVYGGYDLGGMLHPCIDIYHQYTVVMTGWNVASCIDISPVYGGYDLNGMLHPV